jgi:type IV fimbrial biogenesis protein FimT
MRRKHRGFTLVEALIAVSILAILAALAGPSLTGMTLNQQLRSAGLDLSSTLTLARSEALTRNADVTVAPTGGNWAQGWTVTAAGGTVLRRQNAYARIAVSGPPQVIFGGEGRPNSTATPFEVTAADAATHTYRCVRIRASGRPYLARGAC